MAFLLLPSTLSGVPLAELRKVKLQAVGLEEPRCRVSEKIVDLRGVQLPDLVLPEDLPAASSTIPGTILDQADSFEQADGFRLQGPGRDLQRVHFETLDRIRRDLTVVEDILHQVEVGVNATGDDDGKKERPGGHVGMVRLAGRDYGRKMAGVAFYSHDSRML